MQSIQAAFMAKEWVDHSLEMASGAKTKQEAAKRAHVNVDKKLKETTAQLAEVGKTYRNAKSTLKGYEKWVADPLEAQRRAKNKMVLTVVEMKQANK